MLLFGNQSILNFRVLKVRGTPICWPENSVNIWNLLWLSRRLIISTEIASVYISIFLDSLTSKRVQTHEISIYFFNKLDRSLVSRRYTNMAFLHWTLQISAKHFDEYLKIGETHRPKTWRSVLFINLL